MDMVAEKQDRARVGELEIAYDWGGSGEPAMVFIHGILEDRSYFVPQLKHFSGQRRVVAFDLRGHGQSSVPTGATVDDFAADVIAVADAAGLDRAVLCGHSMAGVVALKVALARPDLVCGVAMVDGTVLFPDVVRQTALTNLVPALAGPHWLEALTGFFRGVILDPRDPEDLAQRVIAAVARTRPEFVRSFFASLMASDYAAELQSARCPLLYIHAKVPTDVPRLRNLRPDAMIGELVGSGHYAMLTAPDQVNSMLDRFLRLIDEPRV